MHPDQTSPRIPPPQSQTESQGLGQAPPTAHNQSTGSNKRSISVSRGSAAYPRKRAVTACQVCRARRTKCDQKKPSCSFCESIGAECTSDPGSLSTFDPASIAIIERLDSLERKLDTLTKVSVQDSGGTGASGRSSSSRATLSDDASTTNGVHYKGSIGNFLPENLDAVSKWPIFQSFNLPNVPPPSQLSSPASLGMPSQTPFVIDELQPAAVNQWLDDFFRYSHCKNPVLDEQSTRRLVRRVCGEGFGWDAESCLVLLVCANGALACPLSTSSVPFSRDTSSISDALFAASLKRLGPTLGSAGVIQAQCLFFAGVFLMSSLRPFDAWRMFLQSLAICQSFTQCDQAYSEGDDRLRSMAEAQGSIYWSSWKSERELRWELGFPDFGDTGLDMPRTFPSCSESYDGDNLRAWYFYLSEISLWRLEMTAKTEMRKMVTGAQVHIFETLAEIADEKVQQVIDWKGSLPLGMKITESGNDLPSGNDGDILKFILRGRTTYFHELISWPFIYAVVNDGEEMIQVRQWAAKGFNFHLERLRINQPGFYHRHHGTWLMIRSSARSACILLAGAHVPDAQCLMPPGWPEAIEATISMLKFWCNDCKGLDATVNLLSSLFANIHDR